MRIFTRKFRVPRRLRSGKLRPRSLRSGPFTDNACNEYERTTHTRYQRRRLRLEGACRSRRGGPQLRACGGCGSRDAAERHEPGHHDVQSALPAAHPRGARPGGLRLFGHAGRLREDGSRQPAARRAGRSGALGHQPRLELGRQRPLFGDDGCGHRGELLRLSVDRPLAR